ncbi:MAG: M14 family metallopeptidase [Proteobacteria bacterium]|nr:M14 family metallopeptidase [Pseudomonadota bacterium]
MIGTTVDGAPIDAVEFGEGSSAVLVIAGLHPLEWIGVETAMALIDRLAITPPRRRTIVVPVVNVDGYRRVEADVGAGRRRYVRGNTRDVDLNRNWPTGWRRSDWRYPGKSTTHGPAARSEPEVDAVCRLVDAHVATGGTLALAISLHSFGRKLLVPWGMRFRPTTHAREHRTLGAVVAAHLDEPYDVQQASHWPLAAVVKGMEIDHFHAAYGARALLVECSRGGLTRDPRTWITPFHWYNPAAPAPIARDLAAALVAACETLA